MPEKNHTWAIRYQSWRQTKHGQEVYAAVVYRARQMRSRGIKHYSMQAIVHVVRYHQVIKAGRDDSNFKINNNYTSYLAREVMATGEFPDNFFSVRD